jgi:hypothetical protein
MCMNPLKNCLLTVQNQLTSNYHNLNFLYNSILNLDKWEIEESFKLGYLNILTFIKN